MAQPDYDWLGGYHGANSWTHSSIHDDTRLARAMQGDLSAAVQGWGNEDASYSISAAIAISA